ncbi:MULTISPECIES: VIT1/CCC1 transporter family protein [unclassified Arthrobacter]|uniref:VIT1/CCC1 transporter family protein n=1 Tax=unclassified Arthrobacter TaxID=235627 RepID=UPI0024DF9840|nr:MULTISPECIES: VIT1/CCC1 transporter family protein [unclassified Arthrobacter]MCC9145863.1 VIT1/CCC1 transporter family protein [Arthrobacter sp. zg-Y919]MDK1277092.1 VIT1/CCC1 transporter family protein [Arthrobacter sp. zg.Y919]MDM7990790.1 VIT1/CCC1 transporter family protein [Arthrobacter sp. zg-Y877]WIB03616.1 VIT1/CCC1 transporter family protein [Arthrobacter sp. zg-Y919]
MNPQSLPEPASSDSSVPTPAEIKRWRQYLADEQAEAATYRYLAERRDGEERDILLALAEAEGRHEAYWRTLLGDDAGRRTRASFRNRLLGLLARRFGSVFVLALAQRAESRSPYAHDPHVPSAMAADEQIHEEVIRGLATRGRTRLSGNFRAAVFGANDGLVSNLALIMGIGATGVSSTFILISGLAGLLSGALSMGAGEYVSVRSQRELLDASRPTQITLSAAKSLDIDANELVLVYRARGMTREAAEHRAAERMGLYSCDCDPSFSLNPEADADTTRDEHESVGTGLGAAASSFCFFASGAVIPVLPYLFGLTGMTAVVLSCVLVGLALLTTGTVVGLLSGGSPLKRALRQLAIGFGAAAATYLLGMLFGTTAL